jgi:hypothetical protein
VGNSLPCDAWSVTSRRRLDPGAVLSGLFAGVTPEPTTVDAVAKELADHESAYDKSVLIEILAKAGVARHRHLIDEVFLQSSDPFDVHKAAHLLFPGWGLDPEREPYASRLLDLAQGQPWDTDGVAAAVATRILGLDSQ